MLGRYILSDFFEKDRGEEHTSALAARFYDVPQLDLCMEMLSFDNQ